MGEGEGCLPVVKDIKVLKDGKTESENSSRMELKRDHECIAGNIETEASPRKKPVKEALNEEGCSEVSNPILSPKYNASSVQTITSQVAELASTNQAVLGEITSTSSGNSVPESLSDEEHSRNGSSDGVSTTQVVLEIPKHVSSTGIRKITFKFSKSKEAYNSKLSSEPLHVLGRVGNSHSYIGYPGDPGRNIASPDTGTNMRVNTCWNLETRNLHFRAPNMELKMSKKVVPKSYPTNVKKLLSTGILDGALVKYISTSREKELHGVIRESGYLCGCSACNFTKVLTAYEFEQHAGGRTRHPNNHIYLENGKPIYSIIQQLKTAPLSDLDEVIKNIAGSSVNMECFKAWKASFHQNNGVTEADENYHAQLLNHPQSIVSFPVQAVEDSFTGSRLPLKQKELMKEMTQEQKHAAKKPSSYIYGSGLQHKKSSEGAIKKRDNDLHRLLFMPNGLPDGAELAYYVKGQRILGGYKQGNGIVCSHCDSEVSPSQFEAHAGWAARRQPYRHIYTSNGLTLHDIAISLANGQNCTTGDSDDMCTLCGDGGDLILCDGCPRAFHPACLELQCLPEGDWRCPCCVENFCPDRKVARPIRIQLTRAVKAPESEIGGCVVCRAHDFSVSKFDDRTVMLCDQCEKEFHVGCLRDSGLCDLKELPKDKWFCCDDCSRVHVALQNLASRGPEMIPASVSSMINRKHLEKGLIDGAADDIQWCILSGKSRYKEHLPLLSRTTAIFRECFDPIVASSGRDLIPVMVYGRNISGQEFGGMYCVVLLAKSTVVSAGLIRVFGQEVAELPIVATSKEHQGKGYFRALFSCIEELLSSLGVKTLVLPAAEEAEAIWTNKLGFQKMSEERMLKYTRELQLTIFKGTSMLEKEVPCIVE